MSYTVGQRGIEDEVADVFLDHVQDWGFGKFKVGEPYTVSIDDVNLLKFFSTLCVLRQLIETPPVVQLWYDRITANPSLDSWCAYVAGHRPTWKGPTKDYPYGYGIPYGGHTLFSPCVTKLVDPKKVLASLKPDRWAHTLQGYDLFNLWGGLSNGENPYTPVWGETYTSPSAKFDVVYAQLDGARV